MTMSNRALESLIWVLIYGGLLTLVLGLFMAERGSMAGPVIAALGVVGTLAGVVLLWRRSRRPD